MIISSGIRFYISKCKTTTVIKFFGQCSHSVSCRSESNAGLSSKMDRVHDIWKKRTLGMPSSPGHFHTMFFRVVMCSYAARFHFTSFHLTLRHFQHFLMKRKEIYLVSVFISNKFSLVEDTILFHCLPACPFQAFV